MNAETSWSDDAKALFRAFLQEQIAWADKIMTADDEVYPNGRSSHDNAIVIGGVACTWLVDESYLRVDPLLAAETFESTWSAALPKL